MRFRLLLPATSLLLGFAALPELVVAQPAQQSAPAAGSSVPRLVKFSGSVGQTSRSVPPINATSPSTETPQPSGAAGEQGALRAGAPVRASASLTFAVYAEQEGGAALWQETQNVALDAEGRYSVLLGAASREGMPAELFATGEPRWLGVRLNVAGDAEASQEQARVLLVSVPYALRAADAETLGGRAASDFVLREELSGWSGVNGVLDGSGRGQTWRSVLQDRPRRTSSSKRMTQSA